MHSILIWKTSRATIPSYHSTANARRRPLILMPHTLTERPVGLRQNSGVPTDADLTRQRAGEPLGQRMIVEGRVRDDDAIRSPTL